MYGLRTQVGRPRKLRQKSDQIDFSNANHHRHCAYKLSFSHHTILEKKRGAARFEACSSLRYVTIEKAYLSQCEVTSHESI